MKKILPHLIPVCATANLIALMLDVFSTERFVLICVNILVHLLHLQTLMYSAPHNGDTAPRIGTKRRRFELLFNCRRFHA